MLKMNIKFTAISTLIVSTFLTTTVFAQSAITNLNDFKTSVVEHMTNRETSFVINYTGDTTEFLTNANSYISQASNSDDYLKWNFVSINSKITGVTNNLNVAFTCSYIDTLDQENYVAQEVQKINSQIIQQGMTEEQKVKAIYDYITAHVKYDFTLQKRSAYNALAEGTTVCQGYALLMDKMLEQAGIKTLIITGNAAEGSHAWNLAQINGKWYHFDTTNGSLDHDKYYKKSDANMKADGFTWDAAAFPVCN